MIEDFPYPYYFYGSDDSLDTDVLIHIPKDEMPLYQEDRKIFLHELEKSHGLEWNTNLIVIENGFISDTIYPKSWIDSVNNSLYDTYGLHLNKQRYPLPIIGKMNRNKLLAIYKTFRVLLSMLSRTHYRTTVKPILKGIHDFHLKIDALSKIDFNTVDTFNQDNTKDVDIWKIVAFYLGQNISLVLDDVEIYTKKDLVRHHPELYPFVYRKEITSDLKLLLNIKIQEYIKIIQNYGIYECKSNIMVCNNEKIDMKNEIYFENSF